MNEFSSVTLSEDIQNEILETLNATVFSMDSVVYIITPLVEPRIFNGDAVSRTLEMTLRLQERYDEFLAALETSLGGIIDVAQFGVSLYTLIEMIFETLEEEISNFNLEHIVMISNAISYIIESGFQAHFPEVCLAWMRSEDFHYNPNATSNPDSNQTREIRINCPVDVYVYDSTGALVASIINDTVIDGLGSIVCLINSNGEKVVYLPGDSEYSIAIIATDNGFVSYSVSEYDFVYGTVTRMENYYDVEISVGDVLTANVPEIPSDELVDSDYEGSSVVYTLMGNDSSPIDPDSSYRGDQINDIYYTVSLVKEGNGGYITGAGTFAEGHFAEVEAQVFPSGEFLGWYENEVLVSTDLKYRFGVRNDVTLTARFTTIETYTLTVLVSGDGRVTNKSIEVLAGAKVQLEALADVEGGFIAWSADAGEFEDETSATTWFTMPACNVTITANFTRSSVVLGDVNGDGSVTGADTNLIFRYVSGTVELTEEQLKAADVNGDGLVTGADTNLVFRFVSGTLDRLG